MLKHLSDMQKSSVYLAFVFFIVFMLILLPIEAGASLFMFAPVAAALATMLLTGESFAKKGWQQLGLHRFSWHAFLAGVWIPMIPIALGFVIVWMTGLGEFGVDAEFQGKEWLLVIGFFTTFIVSAITVSLGEEAGWRGYLAAKLRKLGMAKALLANGFIWALFHLPIILLTDAYHDDVNKYLYIPMFVLTVTFAGAFMTYLRYKSGSVWPAVAAHTAHNLAWNYGDMLTQDASPLATYITGDAGLVLIVFYIVIFIRIVKKHGNQELL